MHHFGDNGIEIGEIDSKTTIYIQSGLPLGGSPAAQNKLSLLNRKLGVHNIIIEFCYKIEIIF